MDDLPGPPPSDAEIRAAIISWLNADTDFIAWMNANAESGYRIVEYNVDLMTKRHTIGVDVSEVLQEDDRKCPMNLLSFDLHVYETSSNTTLANRILAKLEQSALEMFSVIDAFDESGQKAVVSNVSFFTRLGQAPIGEHGWTMASSFNAWTFYG